MTMRNIFGINVTEQRDNTAFDGDCFRIRHVSATAARQIEEMQDTFSDFQEKAQIPGWLDLIQGILIMLAVILTGGILRAGTQLTGSIWTLCIIVFAVACWAGVFGIKAYRKRKIKTVTSDATFSESSEKADDIVKAAMQELRIPPDAPSADLFSTTYKMKNGKVKPTNFSPFFSMMNLDFFLFVEDGMLCIADLFDVYAVPLDDILSMELWRKRVSFPNWNKEEAYNAPEYKPFKITCNDSGQYSSKVYEVKLKKDFMLLLPVYDQPTFSKLTGIFPQ